MIRRLAQGLALASTGLLAGAFTYARASVVPTFEAVPMDVHLEFRTTLMHTNGIVMQTLMGASVVTSFTLAALLRSTPRWWAVGAGSLALTSFLVTRFGNVPINGIIRTWSAQSLPADHAELLARWNMFHDIRTGAAVAAFVSLIVATDRLRTHGSGPVSR